MIFMVLISESAGGAIALLVEVASARRFIY